MAQLDFHILDY